MTTLFVSHGPPTMLLTPSRSRDFLAGLGHTLPRPRAILLVSAHFVASEPTLTTHAAPDTIHDFLGMPADLYRLQYTAPGDPGLAARVAESLRQAQLPVRLDPHRGFDHGAWTVMRLMYPEADIPVVQLSLIAGWGADRHYRLGRSLRGIADDGVLVLGSGGMTHNLRALDWKSGTRSTPPLAWVSAFTDWFESHTAAADSQALCDYRDRAPHAAENHPTEEHLLPFFVALGASRTAIGRRIHSDTQMRALAMDAYAFE